MTLDLNNKNIQALITQCRDEFIQHGRNAERAIRRGIVKRRRMSHTDALYFCIGVIDAIRLERFRRKAAVKQMFKNGNY